MFKGKALKDLVELFKKRQVMLYHSCQFIDFQSYTRIGGIPSRQLLEDRGLSFTPFETDKNDQDNSVWDKVFLNLSDFGNFFGRDGIPTVYGPIAFVVRPQALLEADDVAICLRSAGSRDFCREKESLNTLQEVNRLFVYSDDQGAPNSSEVKITPVLCKEFDLDYASNPEISCHYAESKLPLTWISYLWVDPYEFYGKSLTQFVKEWLATQRIDIEVKERICHRSRRQMYNEIADILSGGFMNLKQIERLNDISPDLRDWAYEVKNKKHLHGQWRRFANYFREGTLLPLLDDSPF